MLTDAEIERYQRQLVLREVGGQGQQAFSRARVAVVGAGGLGSAVLFYLAAAGVGRITIIDDDRVELSNLQRQILFGTEELGQPKAIAAARRLAAFNPHVELVPADRRLDADNAHDLLKDHDVIADGCDSFATRAVVNRAAVRLRVPLVSAALGAFDGQLGVFAGHRPDQPCWACFSAEPADRPGESCADLGLVGAVAGVLGSVQALETLRLLHPFGTARLGRLWLFDALDLRGRSIAVPKDPGCPVCGATAGPR